jgi:hypothetical protein
MMVFFKIWPENVKKTITLQALRFKLNCLNQKLVNFKKTIITLHALRFKLTCLNQTCLSLKSIMQLTKNKIPDSATIIEKKGVENQL